MKDISQAERLLKVGKIGIIPTDTIYGIVGLALNPRTVEKIYELRKRATDKPMIILIADLSDLSHFNIKLTDPTIRFLKKIWPNPVSVILPCPDENFTYLHRGSKTLAFRMPKDRWLMGLLRKVGPLVAPSANIEGKPVAENIEDAKNYFGSKVSFYVDGGKLMSKPSTVIQLYQDGTWVILREGSFRV